LPGVKDVEVDLATDRFTVYFVADEVSIDQMHGAVKSLGYAPTTVSSALERVDKSNAAEIPEPVLSALSEARASGKLLFLDFQAAWCGACKIMENTTFADGNVKETLTKYLFLKIDADEDDEATEYFGVVGLPTLVVLDASGNEKYRHVGPISVPDLDLDLRNLLSNP